MEKVIVVNGLTKKFKNLIAVNNLELNVFRGDVFGFLGPNGAGKSTTIRMLLSLIKPTAGSINILGKPLKQNRKEILRRIGAIVEKPDFYLYLSANKNLEILGKTSGIGVDNKRIMEMLELVKLVDRANSKVKTFSHGMKQRLGIAQALLHDPELIILDEPTTGLDPEGMKEVRDLIVHLAKDQGKTIFLSSHLLSEIELIATRMIIINKGKTQIEGKVSELLSSDKLQVKFEFDDIDKAIKVLNGSRWIDFVHTKSKDKLMFEIKKEEIPLLNKYFVENDVGVSAVIPTRSLEEFFLKITREM